MYQSKLDQNEKINISSFCDSFFPSGISFMFLTSNPSASSQLTHRHLHMTECFPARRRKLWGSSFLNLPASISLTHLYLQTLQCCLAF